MKVGLDAEAVAHPHQVLGREVARGHLREGRAADATDARVEGRDAHLDRQVCVRERLTIRVVQMQRDLVLPDGGVVEGVQERAHLTGRADAAGVPERELVAAIALVFAGFAAGSVVGVRAARRRIAALS